MEEEIREQPTMEQTEALHKADIESVASDVGSQTLGKFKNTEALLEAYNNLQSEFTKKCQQLSLLKKDKIVEECDENSVPVAEKEDMGIKQNQDEILDNHFQQFLDENHDAVIFADEIKKQFQEANTSFKSDPFEEAWAKVIFDKLKEKEIDSSFVSQYILSNESIKNTIIENYLNELKDKKPPLTMSSKTGERLSGVVPDDPLTMEDAKKMVGKMFS